MNPQKILLLIFFALFSFTAGAQNVNWLTNYKEAKALAQDQGKPLLLDFTAPWCKPCRVMEANFWTRTDVIEFSHDFVCVKVDFDNELSLRSKYGINAIPNVVFTDSWGLFLLSEKGFGGNTDEKIFRKLGYLPKDFSEIKDAGNLLENEKNNIAALTKVADFYHQRRFYFQSNGFYARLLKLETDAEKRQELMLKIGYNYLRSNVPDEALDLFEKFQKEFPQSPKLERALFGRFYALQKKNKTKEAQKILVQLKTAFPESKLIAEAEKLLSESK